MGVLNVTPVSFSDGGSLAGPEAAVARGLKLFGDGADWVDVGGESTRPGAARVFPDQEARRVVPTISVEAPIAGVYRCELIPTKNPDEFHIDIWYQFAMGMSNEDLLQAYDDAIYLEEGDKVTIRLEVR